jgi:hypothetical protein
MSRAGGRNPSINKVGNPMDMRISSSSAAATGSVSQWHDRKQAGKDLVAALKSGDLEAAQSAYATMTKDGTGKLASHSNTLMAHLGEALQSGDMASAQKIAAGMAFNHQVRSGGGNGSGGGTAPPPPVTETLGNNLNVVA